MRTQKANCEDGITAVFG